MTIDATPHVVLLGDSILDNGSYTRGEPDVVRHLRAVLPPRWRATLAAVDGAMMADVEGQLADVPADATHLVLSVGGNDVLRQLDLLHTATRSSADALRLFASRLAPFEEGYRRTVAAVLRLDLPVTLCTIYNGNLPGDEGVLAPVALTLFNDVILRVGFERAASLIELRSICTAPADYANPIEPSGTGGLKIARAIARAVGAAPDGGAPLVIAGEPRG